MFAHLLWMHDLSARADACLGAILTLSRGHAAHITLAHATGALDPEGPVGRDARARFSRLAEELARGGVVVDAVVRAGTPLDLALAEHAARPWDLLIAARTAATGLDRVLLGSTAARLVRDAPAPALVVGPNGLSALREIVCPVDPLQPALRPLQIAAHLASEHGAALTLLAVVEVGSGDEDLPAARDAVLAAAQAALGELPPGSTAAAVAGETVLHGILHASRTADLVVVGTHGRHGLGRLLAGSVAESLTRAAPCSVLVAR
jgi:nucleotide-binding universal stress UspA family protein